MAKVVTLVEDFLAQKMIAVDAVVGGEGNGGVMLPDLNLTRDAAVAAALVLNLLAAREESLDEILAARTRYHMVKRKVARGEVDPEDIYQDMRAGVPVGANENTEDGLRLEWPDAREWLHVRPSGTEPILRLIAEAPSLERAENLVALAAESVNAGAN